MGDQTPKKRKKEEVRVLKNPGEVGGQQLLPTASEIKKIIIYRQSVSLVTIQNDMIKINILRLSKNFIKKHKVKIKLYSINKYKIYLTKDFLYLKICLVIYKTLISLNDKLLIRICYVIVKSIFNLTLMKFNKLFNFVKNDINQFISLIEINIFPCKIAFIYYQKLPVIMIKKTLSSEEEKRKAELDNIGDKMFSGELFIEMTKYVPIILNLEKCNIAIKFLLERLCEKLKAKKKSVGVIVPTGIKELRYLVWIDERLINKMIEVKISFFFLNIDIIKKIKESLLYSCTLRNEWMRKNNRKLYENLSRCETAIRINDLGIIEKDYAKPNDIHIKLVPSDLNEF